MSKTFENTRVRAERLAAHTDALLDRADEVLETSGYGEDYFKVVHAIRDIHYSFIEERAYLNALLDVSIEDEDEED